MEIDKTQLTHDVAKAVWSSLDPLGLEAPFDEQDSMIQFSLKSKVLPVINHTLPVAETHFKQKIRDILTDAHSNDLSAEEILFSIEQEVGL